MEQNYWRKCGSCKKEIPLGGIYQCCSISSCKKFAYCSVECWDLHNSVMNHKSAWAEEERAPKTPDNDSGDRPVRRIIVSPSGGEKAPTGYDLDVLIVASKLKKYVKDRYDMNTSANVMDALSHLVRRLTDDAVENARAEGRKTLMDRDFK